MNRIPAFLSIFFLAAIIIKTIILANNVYKTVGTDLEHWYITV